MSSAHTHLKRRSQSSFSLRGKKAKKVIKHKTPVPHLIFAWSIVIALMIALELL